MQRAPAELHERQVVFLSHATPDNNSIAAWYGARLTAAGYEVWSDITRLLGGEEMWVDIADALRYHARKFVVLLSRAAVLPTKEGIRAELDRAHAYRKLLQDRRYIIPVKIDDVPYEDLPPTISNRLIISAEGNHASAIARVLKVLEEDRVLRSANPRADALLRWQHVITPDQSELEAAPDTLISNWFPFVQLPHEIFFYDIERPLKNAQTEPAKIAKDHPVPMGAYLRKLVSFANWDEVQEPLGAETPIKLEHQMSLDTFLAGGNDAIRIAPGEAKKVLASILRQAFDRMAIAKGLRVFALSDKKNAWWMPKDILPNDKQTFTRVSGTTGYRKLAGLYGYRERDWHFGIAASPLLDSPMRMKVTPHIIYTDPSGANQPTASYRRAHCKLWFNAKWRDLLYGMAAYLADAKGHIVLPLGANSIAALSGTPAFGQLFVRPPAGIERKAAKSNDSEGDAADLDMAAYADDPAFSELIGDDADADGTEHDDAGEDE